MGREASRPRKVGTALNFCPLVIRPQSGIGGHHAWRIPRVTTKSRGWAIAHLSSMWLHRQIDDVAIEVD